MDADFSSDGRMLCIRIVFPQITILQETSRMTLMKAVSVTELATMTEDS
jgi:hypothetical protein